jgi:carbonic anhydrase/acetyltransferase-like protein (isoleucine patch superfamily)
MAIYQLDEHVPQIDPDAFVFDSADLIGRVVLQAGVSVWPNVTIRADNEEIFVGRGSSVQDGTVMHVDPGQPLHVGEDVTIGHQAMLHGCTIGNHTLIGMQAIVLNGAVVGSNCLVGAGAIIPEGRVIPDGVLVLGVGKIARPLTEAEIVGLGESALHYREASARYRQGLKKLR